MKKTLLTLGSIAAVITPVVAVVSCGKDEKSTNTKTNTTQTATGATTAGAPAAGTSTENANEVQAPAEAVETIETIRTNAIKTLTDTVNSWFTEEVNGDVVTFKLEAKKAAIMKMTEGYKDDINTYSDKQDITELLEEATTATIRVQMDNLLADINKAKIDAKCEEAYNGLNKWLQNIYMENIYKLIVVAPGQAAPTPEMQAAARGYATVFQAHQQEFTAKIEEAYGKMNSDATIAQLTTDTKLYIIDEIGAYGSDAHLMDFTQFSGLEGTPPQA